MKKITFLFALLCASVMAFAVQYCELPTGHLGDANFGDASGRVLLTLQKDGNNVIVKLKNNTANGNPQTGLNYMWVNATGATNNNATYGSHSTANTEEISVTVEFSEDKDSYTFNNIHWAYEGFGGEWAIDGLTVAASELCAAAACADNENPTISAVATSDITYNSAVLTVTASDNIGVTGYIVKNGASQIASSATSPITITGLTAATTYDNIKVIAKDACNNESAEFAVSSFTTEAFTYCSFATGHLGQANFGDANGRILLTLTKLSASSVGVTVEPNNGGADVFDFVEVILGGVSHTLGAVGGSAPTNTEIVFDGLASLDFSINVLWHNHNWADAGGRWTTQSFAVTEAELCPAPAESEYCGYEDPQTIKNGKNITLTWITDESGNVVIKMGNGTGTTSCSFRNGGFEGGIGAFVVSDDDFATTTPASDYFTAVQVYSGNTYTLTKIADLPANAKIKHIGSGHALAWVLDGKDEYCFPDFIYTYGAVCTEEPVLTSIVLSASTTLAQIGVDVTLTATPLDQFGTPIEATVNYEISPAGIGSITGNVFTFAQTGVATITAKSGDIQNSITLYGVPSANLALNQPSEGGYYDNNPAEGFDKANDGNNNTAWVTYADKPASVEWWYVDLGAIYSITAVDVVWGDPSSTSYKLFARTEAPSEDDKANDAAWEEIASVSGIGINSEQFNVVSVNARYVRVHSLTKSANYLRMKEVSVFGTEYVPVADTEAPVMTSASLESATFTEAVINVAATDNVGIYRFHVVDDANGIDANYAEADGKITVTGLTHATNYNFTITAKDAAGNESENSKVVAVSTPFDGSINLALNQPCEGGYYDNNPAESADKANDGNNGTSWVTYGDHAAALDWWVVDLGKVYNLTNITALWANDAYATQYLLQARVVAPTNEDKADDAAWVTLETVSGVTAGEERSTNVSGVGRYVRFRALAHTGFFRLREFRVYGSGVATVDTEAPVMTSASLVSNTDAQAVIAVAATDNQGIANYHVVDAGNSFDANFAASEGNITVTGLTGGTNYTLVITAVDFFGNESENSKSVAVTTTAHYTEPQAACAAPTWDAELVKAMYSPTYSADCGFDAWGSGSVFTDDTYGKKCAVGNAYFGMVNFTLNCLMMEKVHFDIWVENNTSIRFVPIWGGTPEQGITKNLTGQEWNSIDIDLADYTGVSNWGNITQFKLDEMPTNFNLWIANAYFYRETAVVDTEAPTNASASLASAGFYSVKITAQADDDSGAVNFSVKNGDDEVATGVAASGVATTITVANLTPGTAYNFNVIAKDEAGNAAAPIAVAANTLAAPAAAPVPTEEESNVKAVYGDVYTPVVAVENYCEWWWESPTVHTNYTLAEGDHVLFYDNNHQAGASFGWAWNANNKIDFSGYQKLHMSIYPAQAGTIEVYPVVAGVTTNKVSETLTANQWNEVVLDFTDKTFAPLNQIGFINFYDLGEFFVDNVYFFSDPDYSRDGLTVGNYGTICLPQAGEIVGATLYEIADYANNMIYVDEVEGGVMEAGKPYIFQATSAQLNVYYTSATVAETAGNANGLHGFYNLENENAQFNIPVDAGNYILYQNQYWLVSGRAAYINNYRAYIKIDEINYVAPAPGIRRVAMQVNGQNTTTGVDNLNAGETPVKVMIDGQLYILRGEKMYDTTGRLVK